METSYSIEKFMGDAKRILVSSDGLNAAKKEIGERLSLLAQRDDLTRYGAQLGPTDASNGTYLLWREPPYFTLILVRFDEFYLSPVHDHGDHWIVACCYRGSDRWDIYERRDTQGQPGACDIELVDQVLLKPGDSLALSAPPRAIHSHNNMNNGDTLELIFSAAKPTPAHERLLFDVPARTCRPSWYEISDQLQGDHYPATT